MTAMSRVVIIGGGPGGYESALVTSQLGAEVTVVDSDGLGGSAVLTDCVPSKTLIATAEVMTDFAAAGELGIISDPPTVDLGRVNQRVKSLALAQSADIEERLAREGVQVVRARGSLDGPGTVLATAADGSEERHPADAILIATGAAPRTLPTAMPDGERILTWEQVYDLDEMPESLIVVGSGVTGAEFASGYLALGIPVTLVSSRDRVLPGEDADAAEVLEDVLKRRGMNVLSRSRMESVTRSGDVVTVALVDGREVQGSHCPLPPRPRQSGGRRLRTAHRPDSRRADLPRPSGHAAVRRPGRVPRLPGRVRRRGPGHFLRARRRSRRQVGDCDLLVEVCNGMPYLAPLWHAGPRCASSTTSTPTSGGCAIRARRAPLGRRLEHWALAETSAATS